VAALNKLED